MKQSQTSLQDNLPSCL